MEKLKEKAKIFIDTLLKKKFIIVVVCLLGWLYYDCALIVSCYSKKVSYNAEFRTYLPTTFQLFQNDQEYFFFWKKNYCGDIIIFSDDHHKWQKVGCRSMQKLNFSIRSRIAHDYGYFNNDHASWHISKKYQTSNSMELRVTCQ